MKLQQAFKVVMCGDGGVGKTNLVNRLVGKDFNPLSRLTVGVSHYVKELEMGGNLLKFVVWDLGGEDRFRFLAPVFLRGARGVVFVFDVTREETLEHLEGWLEVMLSTIGDVPRVLVGNKVDLEDMRVVIRSYAEAYAKSRGFLAYVEASAKLGVGIEEPFLLLARALAGGVRG